MGKRLCTRASDFRNEKDVTPYNVSDNKIRKEKPSMNGSVVLIDKADDFSNPSELNKHIIDHNIDVLNLPKETAGQKKMALFAKVIHGDWDQTYSGGPFSNIISELLGMLRFE